MSKDDYPRKSIGTGDYDTRKAWRKTQEEQGEAVYSTRKQDSSRKDDHPSRTMHVQESRQNWAGTSGVRLDSKSSAVMGNGLLAGM